MSHVPTPQPPRRADQLLEWFVAPHRLESLQGDLHEEFAYQVERVGVRRARWRYWRDVLSFARPWAMKRQPADVPEHETRFFLHPDMLRNYLKIAVRNLWKNKVYSGMNIVGLALGLACCTAIGLYVADEYQYDRFHTNFDRIYRLAEHQKQADGWHDVVVTPGPLAPTLTHDFSEVAQTLRIAKWGGVIGQGRQVAEAEQMLIVDPSFFSLFDFPLMAGNRQQVLRSPNDLVISESMAARLFGANWARMGIIGQPVSFNGDQTFTLSGVVKNPPERSHLQFDVLLPYAWLAKTDEWSQKWNSNNYHTYILLNTDRLGTSANLAALTDKLSHQLNRYQGDSTTTLFLQPLRDIYLRSKFDFQTDWGKRSDILYVRIFLTVGLIVLLIAVVNFINLATARASQRAREVGIRKAVGAQRLSLIAQFLGEALLMTSLAVGVALLLVETLLPLFNDLSGKQLCMPVGEPQFWLMLAGLTGVVSLLTGLYPAFFLSSFRPARVLKSTALSLGLAVKSGQTFRQSLVVGQFALAVGLVIGSVVIYRQLAFMQTKKLGFDQSQLLYIRLKGDLRTKALTFKREIEQLPGVASAAATTSNLVDVNNGSDIEWEGQRPNDKFSMTNMNVDADFLKTTGMQLAAGRNFSWRIPSDTSGTLGAFMINETAARRMGWTPATAIGKRIKFWGPWGIVVGVLKDFHFRPLRVAIEPFLFRFRPTDSYFSMLVKTKANVPMQHTIADVTARYTRYERNSPISYGFVDQELDAQYRAEQRTGRIILYFSILSVFVSCLGLFGLATFTAESRTKEIGIRKVLGASVSSIVALLSKDFLKLVGIAIVIASPLAWWAMNTWLTDFVYKIQLEWWMFVGAGTLAVGIALLTVSFQSIRAALTNPVKSLRTE